jgi:hypothetical protein
VESEGNPSAYIRSGSFKRRGSWVLGLEDWLTEGLLDDALMGLADFEGSGSVESD